MFWKICLMSIWQRSCSSHFFTVTCSWDAPLKSILRKCLESVEKMSLPSFHWKCLVISMASPNLTTNSNLVLLEFQSMLGRPTITHESIWSGLGWHKTSRNRAPSNMVNIWAGSLRLKPTQYLALRFLCSTWNFQTLVLFLIGVPKAKIVHLASVFVSCTKCRSKSA